MRVMLATNAADLDFSEGTQIGLDRYWDDVQKLFKKFGPMYLSTKLDGVRGVVNPGPLGPEVMSRTWKPISSRKIQEVFGSSDLYGLDGEFIAGNETDPNAMQASSSATSARNSQVIPTFNVFDCCLARDLQFTERLESLHRFEDFMDSKLRLSPPKWAYHTRVIPQTLVYSASEARAMVEQFIKEGYEGGMLRRPSSPYKEGRSTLREGYLLKLKIWADDDAVILDGYEAMHNENLLTHDERGYAKRSSAKGGLVPAGYLGGYHVRSVSTGAEFDIGIAVKGVWTLEIRKTLWQTLSQDIGRTIKYRYFPTGIVDKPRFPKFVAFRDESDLVK